MDSLSEDKAVYLIHPVVNDKEFWAYWPSYTAFTAQEMPQTYHILAQSNQALKDQLKASWAPAQNLATLSLAQTTAIYRRVRFAELPDEIQTHIQEKLALKAQLKRRQQITLLQALGLPLDTPLDSPDALKELKRLYRKLAFRHHPDQGGSPEAFQYLQQTYQELLRWHSQDKA